jgi:hypothetical protein
MITEQIEKDVVGQTQVTMNARFSGIIANLTSVVVISGTQQVKGSNTEAVKGMRICEAVKRMFNQAKPVLEWLVEVDGAERIGEMLAQRQAEQQEYERQISDIEEELSMPNLAPLKGETQIEGEVLRLMSVELERAQRETEGGRAKGKGKEAEDAKSMKDELKARIREEVLIAAAVRTKEYEENEVTRATREKEKRGLKKKNENESLVINSLHFYMRLMKAMGTKIVNSANEVPGVRKKLQQKVTLRYTQKVYNDPLAAENVSGMWQLLREHYHVATFASFSRSLLEALEIAPAIPTGGRDNSAAVLAEVNQKMQDWASMKYWDYFTQDVFWAVITIKALDEGSELKEFVMLKLTERCHEWAHQHETDEDGEEEEDRAPPELMELVTSWIKLKSEAHPGKDKDTGKKDAGAGTRLRPYQSYAQRTGGGGAEQAARAEGGPGAGGKGEQGGAERPKEPDKVVKYSREVAAEEKVMFTIPNSNHVVSYTATAKPCVNCSHKPRCFSKFTCNKCLHYGHRADSCRQDGAWINAMSKKKDFAGRADAYDEGEDA